MIDDRLDSKLIDLNHRYQEALYSEQAEIKKKKNRYFGIYKDRKLKPACGGLKIP